MIKKLIDNTSQFVAINPLKKEEVKMTKVAYLAEERACERPSFSEAQAK
jgi:hypothetical protein